MLVALAAVVVLAGAAFVATGIAAAVRSRALRAGLATIGVGLGGLIVVTLALVLVVGGTRQGRGSDDEPSGSTRSTTGSPSTTTEPEDRDRARPPAGRIDKHDMVFLAATEPSAPPAAVRVVDHLADRDVLRIEVSGLPPATGSHVEQCRRTADGFSACRNHFPVEVADDGTATFQYQVSSGGKDGCGPDDACAVVIGPGGGTRAFAYTVFGAAAPSPARLQIEPTGPYREGQRVVVTTGGLPAGSAAAIAFCSPRCNQVTPVRGGADGVGRATVTMRPRCDGWSCSVALVGTGARDTMVPVRFVPAPVPDHDARRIAAGLSGAGTALLLAWFVARRTDWDPPSEAATPELDAAEL